MRNLLIKERKLYMNATLLSPKTLLVSGSSLDVYLARIKKIPLLTAKAEKKLAEDLYYRKDLSAAQELIVSNLRFVVYIAQSYIGYGLALADLIQEGNVGLMKAVKRFDPRMKVRLISFAVHWIKAEIQEFILRNWRLVKVATTKAKRKLFFNLRKIKKRLGWANFQEVKQIAQNLGVKPDTVREMESHLSVQDMSLDAGSMEDSPYATGENISHRLPVMAFSDSRYDPARLIEATDNTEQGNHMLQSVLTKLDARSLDIITQRWLVEPKVTLDKLAKYYKVSIERIRQLEQNAIKKLREKIGKVYS